MKPELNCPVRKTTNPDIIGKLDQRIGLPSEVKTYVLDFGTLIKTDGKGYEFQKDEEWYPIKK